MQLKVLLRVMRGEGIKGQADPAALKEFPECDPDRFFNSLDVQVEYAAEEDVNPAPW